MDVQKHYRGTGLQKTVAEFFAIATQHPIIENAWLSAAEHKEELAAQQIEGSIGVLTPKSEQECICHHAQDEWRHAEALRGMRTISQFTSDVDLALEARFRAVASSFVLGYFGNPLLQEAKNRHVAYVHGAMTIEQFPFQIYTQYLELSKMPKVKELMPAVIADEYDHLKLGHRLREQLPEEDLIPTAQLLEIEKEMTVLYMQRMKDVAESYLRTQLSDAGADAPERSFEEQIGSDEAAYVAWGYALGWAEREASRHMQMIYSLRGLPAPDSMQEHVEDEERHARLIHRSLLLKRRKLMVNSAYREFETSCVASMRRYLRSLFAYLIKEFQDPALIHGYGAVALESRVFKHYKMFSGACDDIGISHTIRRILADEGRHIETMHTLLRQAQGYHSQILIEVRAQEEILFLRAQQKALTALGHYHLRREPSVLSSHPLAGA